MAATPASAIQPSLPTGQFAGFDQYPAFTTGALATAGGIDVNAGFHGGTDKRFTGQHLDFLVMGEKFYFIIGHDTSSFGLEIFEK